MQQLQLFLTNVVDLILHEDSLSQRFCSLVKTIAFFFADFSREQDLLLFFMRSRPPRIFTSKEVDC